MTVLPAGISVPPIVVGTRASRNVPLIGLSSRSISSMNTGMSRGSSAELLLELGSVAEGLQRGAEEAGRGLLAGGEQVGGDAHHVVDRGRVPSGKVAVARPVMTSSRGWRRHSSM